MKEGRKDLCVKSMVFFIFILAMSHRGVAHGKEGPRCVFILSQCLMFGPLQHRIDSNYYKLVIIVNNN